MTTNTAAAEKVFLLKFSSRSCPACAHMARSKVLERFVAKYPEVTIITLDCADEEGETPKGTDYEANFKLSDVYGVESFPTLVFEAPGGGELASWEGGVPMNELEKTYKAARDRLAAAKEAQAKLPPTEKK